MSQLMTNFQSFQSEKLCLGRKAVTLLVAAALLPVAPASAQPPAPIVPTAERAGINLPVTLCAMRQERLDTGPATQTTWLPTAGRVVS